MTNTNWINITFNNEPLQVKEGEILSSVLWRNDIRELSESFKMNQLKGMYCGSGYCQSCCVEYMGKKVRSCQLKVVDGMCINYAKH